MLGEGKKCKIMKLKNELPYVIERFAAIKDKVNDHANSLLSEDKYAKSKERFITRLAWDCFHATIPTSVVLSWYKKYDCHDPHIDTLVKTALKTIYNA